MKITLFRGNFCITSAFPTENSKFDRRLLCILHTHLISVFFWGGAIENIIEMDRQLGDYRDQQKLHKYNQLTFNRGDFRDAANLNPEDERVDIGAATALLVGVGAAGGETARLCQALGMKTLGVDARRTEPHPFIDELYGAEKLDELLPLADFVLLTIPHTPETEGLFDSSKFALMKPTSVFVNVGRGATTKLHGK